MSIEAWWKGYHGDVRTALLRLTDVQANPKTAITVRNAGRVFDEQIGAWLVTVTVDADHVVVWFGPRYSKAWQSPELEWSPNATGALGLEWLHEALTAADTMTHRHTGCHSHLLAALRTEVEAARKAWEIANA